MALLPSEPKLQVLLPPTPAKQGPHAAGRGHKDVPEEWGVVWERPDLRDPGSAQRPLAKHSQWASGFHRQQGGVLSCLQLQPRLSAGWWE